MQLFHKYGFADVAKENYATIQNSQGILRELAIDQITPQTLDKHLKMRKMTRKESFRLYMLGLIDELKGGTILKRISKEKSEEINQVVDSENNINFESFQSEKL